MASRALPDLVARIRVDSTGVDQAMSNLVGSFGRANLALAGVAAGIGILVVGGKSMIDISEKHDAATLGLAQAYKSAGVDLGKYQGHIDDFIKTNRRYVGDQSEVIDGYAKLTRSGLSQTEVQRAMNDAVDLAAIKHISLTDAVGLLDNAEHGRMRGLIDLGITSAKYTDAQGNLILANHSVAKAMDELDAKLKGGRETLTDLQKKSNTLSNDWQDLAAKGGPVLLTALNAVVTAASKLYDWFDKTGKDDHLWATISDRLVLMGRWLHDYVLGPMADASNWLSTHGNASSSASANQFFNPLAPGRAAGGPVLPNSIYTVGEAGPETLVMGAAGGTVIPHGGGGGINVTVNGSNLSPWDVANEIAWAKKTRRL